MSEIKKANGHRYGGLVHAVRKSIDEGERPDASGLAFDLASAARAVFALQARVPSDAFTAKTLGTEREGNAVLISDDGLLLTIGYLVTEAEQIVLTDIDHGEHHATLVGYDQETGFGLLRLVEDMDIRPLSPGSAESVNEGDRVIAVAHGGVSHSLDARITSKREFAGYWEYLLDEALFTAPPHPHWSGSALLNTAGELVGIGSLYVQDALPGENSVAGNMFVPLDLLPPILNDLVSFGQTSRKPRPWLGMLTSEMDNQLVVAAVTENAPASRSGIRVGDLIVAVNGVQVHSLPDFYRKVWALGAAGVDVPFTLFRDGTIVRLTVGSGDRADFLKRPNRH